MNIINILMKEVKQSIRNKRAILMMVLLPIVLSTILGTALTGLFDTAKNLKDINLLYTIEGNGPTSSSFNTLMEKGQKMGITFTAVKNFKEGADCIRDAKYTAYIVVKEDQGTIELFKNNRQNFEANFAETFLNTFVQRYNAVHEIAEVSPRALGEINKENPFDYIQVESLDKKRQPSAKDYYGVTILTLIILYSSLSGAWSIKGETVRKTGSRIICSPVKKHEIFLGKILGVFLITSLQISIVILFSKYVLKAYWGPHMGIVLLLIAAEVVMAISVGIGAAFLIKNETAMAGVLNMIIPFVVFFGGGYVPLENLSKLLQQIANVSPLKWTNQAIFQVIYSSNFSLAPAAVTINLAVAAVILVISSFVFRKEAM